MPKVSSWRVSMRRTSSSRGVPAGSGAYANARPLHADGDLAEPSIEQTRHILYSLRPRLERNYSVRIKDEAIETALSGRGVYLHPAVAQRVLAAPGRGCVHTAFTIGT